MKNTARFLWILVLAQAFAFLMVMGWQVCRKPLPYVPKKHVYAELHGSLPTILNMFSNDCGRYPTTAEGWKVLLINPTNAPLQGWHGPYFDPLQDTKDPWGHEYVYRFPGIRNTNGFEIYSCGPDGISKSGGSDLDDINTWDELSPRGGKFLTLEDGRDPFFRAVRILLVIPFLFVVRFITGVLSPRVRAFGSGYLAADIVWLLISVGVFVAFFGFAATHVAGR